MQTPIDESIERFEQALKTFTNGDNDNETDVIDFLVDIRHFCDKHDLPFHTLNDRAYEHYVAELHDARQLARNEESL